MSHAESAPSALRIGTRGSRLARWQADWVASELSSRNPDLKVEIVEIKTQGDRDRTSPLSAIGGMGLFTKEIQRAVMDGLVDVAVHSLKDLPTQGPTTLSLAAVPAREGVADALISPRFRTLATLPAGATVGTSSQRRRAQLLYLRPDLKVVDLRGNVETRLNAAIDGQLDAVVLAEAGLHRLGLLDRVTELLAPPRFLPAVGQGALGIECRSDDLRTRELLRSLDDPATHANVTVERSILAELEGGCTIPLAVWARQESGAFLVDAAVFDLDGRQKVSHSASSTDAGSLVGEVVSQLRGQGAEQILASVRHRQTGSVSH